MIKVDFTLQRDIFDVRIKENFHVGITGIYGASGSGKTSLLQSIAGLATPEKGFVKIYDNIVFNSELDINIPVQKRNIGYVFQEGRLFPHMTIEKNLLYGIKRFGSKHLGFDQVVDLLNLRHLLQTKPAMVSGGERQRTALGRALLSAPKILLLDEPFSAVDVQLRSQILPFLLKIHRKVKIPILVVSHDLPDLLKLTDRLCLIQKGRCIGHADYHDLLRSDAALEMFGKNSIMNSITMKVKEIDTDRGITILSNNGEANSVRVKCEKSNQTYKVGEEMKIFISSDDIALSREKLKEVTIQNQLKGVIVETIDRGATTLCIVDVGFQLVVEITAESGKKMFVEPGNTVWCLFKSVAIDVAG
ncbi:molybdenum ABC transporter ATP-binding protein [Carboxylicivirga linearis]|uniref:Molybdenum ABC transporter ATP-binding protein n=1 Tax=Carboxylicivirga linearis TaxID=1628157 RepID=A0ABS5JV89_9BACT|nr:molybdenum ABC transporter ATP-binding protein [Carboxylicivirga linearis]MBS2098797.1 molybdenum ABC transporter ATP-binding protein [Carboxylicivirga linearis]